MYNLKLVIWPVWDIALTQINREVKILICKIGSKSFFVISWTRIKILHAVAGKSTSLHKNKKIKRNVRTFYFYNENCIHKREFVELKSQRLHCLIIKKKWQFSEQFCQVIDAPSQIWCVILDSVHNKLLVIYICLI